MDDDALMRTVRDTLAGQFGAALDMLEHAMDACPDALWRDPALVPGFWYVSFHTLFWLDYYLGPGERGYVPPAPFTRDELDPAGLLPERVYEKDELRAYLALGREHLASRLASLGAERAARPAPFARLGLSELELMAYNLRHAQHHAGQLQMLLRQHGTEPPRWVGRHEPG